MLCLLLCYQYFLSETYIIFLFQLDTLLLMLTKNQNFYYTENFGEKNRFLNTKMEFLNRFGKVKIR